MKRLLGLFLVISITTTSLFSMDKKEWDNITTKASKAECQEIDNMLQFKKCLNTHGTKPLNHLTDKFMIDNKLVFKLPSSIKGGVWSIVERFGNSFDTNTGKVSDTYTHSIDLYKTVGNETFITQNILTEEVKDGKIFNRYDAHILIINFIRDHKLNMKYGTEEFCVGKESKDIIFKDGNSEIYLGNHLFGNERLDSDKCYGLKTVSELFNEIQVKLHQNEF